MSRSFKLNLKQDARSGFICTTLIGLVCLLCKGVFLPKGGGGMVGGDTFPPQIFLGGGGI